jgi:hypothetical protein
MIETLRVSAQVNACRKQQRVAGKKKTDEQPGFGKYHKQQNNKSAVVENPFDQFIQKAAQKHGLEHICHVYNCRLV